MKFERNETNKNSNGGTEQMMERIYSSLPDDLLQEYQIIPSRLRDLKEDKLRVYYVHDLANDPESKNALEMNGGWARFHRIVFVSHWQRNSFLEKFPQIPYSKTAVIQNAIEPFKTQIVKPKDKINLIYHTTPHRGLNILISVVEKLREKHPEIHLDVFSSFGLYGWKERDKEYETIFNQVDSHKDFITNHGSVSNEVVREYLEKAHIFAYPSIWPETSCICLMEAMSAQCLCVHPDFAALAETAANWTLMYNWDEDLGKHARNFYNALDVACERIKASWEQPDNMVDSQLLSQASYANLFYNWEIKKKHWEAFLKSFADEDREIKTSVKVFRYEA